jgi:hypothetical protein
MVIDYEKLLGFINDKINECTDKYDKAVKEKDQKSADYYLTSRKPYLIMREKIDDFKTDRKTTE